MNSEWTNCANGYWQSENARRRQNAVRRELERKGYIEISKDEWVIDVKNAELLFDGLMTGGGV